MAEDLDSFRYGLICFYLFVGFCLLVHYLFGQEYEKLCQRCGIFPAPKVIVHQALECFLHFRFDELFELGFVGRGEGCEVYAVALLHRDA